MSNGATWWAVARGGHRFALRTDGEARIVAGEEVLWSGGPSSVYGAVSGSPRPIAVRDICRTLALPAKVVAQPTCALVADSPAARWAIACDELPVRIGDPHRIAAPSLPPGVARGWITGAIDVAGTVHFVIDPGTWDDAAAPDPPVSEDRIEIRRRRIAGDVESADPRPHLLVSCVGEPWWAIPADEVRLVVRVDRISPLPGAEHAVWGLATIGGRVNAIVDPSRLLRSPEPELPCWVAEMRSAGAKWAVAAPGELRVAARADVEAIDDRTPPVGPAGLVGRRVRLDGVTVHVLAADVLRAVAGGDVTNREGAPR